MKVNDGQLDHSNRRIAELEQSLRAVQEVCARRLELLKEVAQSAVERSDLFYARVDIGRGIWDTIQDETDENEVQS